MIRRLLAAISLLAPPAASSADAIPERPNILFLFADDYTYEAIGALGMVDIETPNLDRLHARGTSFSRAYNMGSWSGAVCVASRCMLMTGRTLWDAHAIFEETDAERRAGRFWPLLMKEAGYDTYFTGKWHIRTDAALAFDVAYHHHVRPGMPSDTASSYHRPPSDGPDPWSPFDRSLGGYWQGGRHWSAVTADDAIDFIKLAKDDDDPFFMDIAFNAPHDPRQSPEAFVERYPPDRVAVPENFLPEYPYKDAIGCGPDLRDEALAPFPRTEDAVKIHRGEYYAIITHLDRQIGRILEALDAAGLDDDTIVVFTADHGLAVGHHGLLGKQNLYDHSVRVPFIVAGPGIEAGRTVDAPIDLQSVMPTALELAGLPVPDYVGFPSLLPLLQGDPGSDRPVYGAYLDLQRSITLGGDKLLLYPSAKVARFYRLLDDPHEMHDLADDPRSAARMAELYRELRRMQVELGDSLDLGPIFDARFSRHS